MGYSFGKLDNMGSLSELQRALRLKDEKIKELQRIIHQKDEKIVELSSQLDKYQSILPQSPTSLPANKPRKQRAQGISAEPQALQSLQDLKAEKLKKYAKPPR